MRVVFCCASPEHWQRSSLAFEARIKAFYEHRSVLTQIIQLKKDTAGPGRHVNQEFCFAAGSNLDGTLEIREGKPKGFAFGTKWTSQVKIYCFVSIVSV